MKDETGERKHFAGDKKRRFRLISTAHQQGVDVVGVVGGGGEVGRGKTMMTVPS